MDLTEAKASASTSATTAPSVPSAGQGRPPILLTNADYYGTLAAARCLGRAGVPVTVAEPSLLAPARWSRFVTRRERCPAVDGSGRLIEWLLEFGRREPGHVLYPTSDDVAWLYSQHREELAEYYHMFQPGASALRRLLNKRELFAACGAAGLDAPLSYFPESEADLEAIGAQATFPLLLKPATQVLLHGHGKGMTVRSRDELLPMYRAFRQHYTVPASLLERFPGADQPMLQAFHPEAAQGIYSVAGFVDRWGCRVVARAARKILQRPRKLGIGLCFEEAPLRPELVKGLTALSQLVGYHGVFEAEFIEAGGRFLLIDFNPRFYSQMAFEVGRGLPLPLLAYEAALGRDGALTAAEQRSAEPAGRVYTHRGIFELLTRGQRLTGRMSAAETARWRGWLRAHDGRTTDAVLDGGDRLPALVDYAHTAYRYLRHPRAFVRSMLLDQ
jgi:D-aspartate ligase